MIQVDNVIIGAGITGLSVAMPLYKKGKDFLILEKLNYIGGQIQTKSENGFIYETGPNTGAISQPEVVDLFNFASKFCELEIANEDSKARWIWKGKKFHNLPSGIIGGITTPLFTLKDKLRILGEPFRKKGTNPYESVGDLAKRRLGKSYVDYAVDPFIGGVYAANPYQVTTKYALPKLYNLEQNYGSFIKGAIEKGKQIKTEREKLATKEVFSAYKGMSRLPEALANIYGDKIKTNISDISLEFKNNNQWIVRFTENNELKEIQCKNIISTIPAYELAGLISFCKNIDIQSITNIDYSPIIELVVGFNHLNGINLKAFGGLIPSIEKKKILGILFPTSCFKDRGPYKDSVIFNIFMGGTRNGTELFPMNDEQIKDIGLKSLYDMLHIPSNINPDLVKVCRHIKAIPIYNDKIGKCFETINEIEAKYKGLYLAGSIRDGIGLANRIGQGVRLGEKLTQNL